MQLIKDYKSRKFLLVVAGIIIIVLNRQQAWGLVEDDINLIFIGIGAYMVMEGIADIIERKTRVELGK